LNERLLQPYVHVLVPQQAGGQQLGGSSQRMGHKDTALRLKKIKGLLKRGLEEQGSGEARLRRLEEMVAEGQRAPGVEQQLQQVQGRLDQMVGEVAQLRELLVAALAQQPPPPQQQQQQQHLAGLLPTS
jgi:hypothetical protein